MLIENISSNIGLEYDIGLTLHDLYDQHLVNDYTSLLQFQPVSGLGISNLLVSSSSGYFNLSQIKFAYQPGGSITAYFSISGIPYYPQVQVNGMNNTMLIPI